MREWTWGYEGYDPGQERLREALCTLGNGYFATRGAAPEADAGPAHYPGTYIAGCYNRLTSTVAGVRVPNGAGWNEAGRDEARWNEALTSEAAPDQAVSPEAVSHEAVSNDAMSNDRVSNDTVSNDDLVNMPNWLPLRFRIRAGDGTRPAWFSPDDGSLVRYRQVLDLRAGVLRRDMCFEDPHGRRLCVEQQRVVHMADPHLAALRTEFTAENWAGELEVESALDGSVVNAGVARYRDLDGRHLTHVHAGFQEPDVVWLRCRTTTSDIRVAMAARVLVAPGPSAPAIARVRTDGGRAAQLIRLRLAPGTPASVEKTVALHTSRDPAVGDPLGAAVERVRRAGDFAELLISHRRAWRHLWRRAELDVPGEAGRILRLHLFHVLQTLSPHTADLDVGVPARGLHGEAYRGHVFWDELFVLPYLNLHFPEVSRALLTYRHRRLPRAVRAAREAGLRGAMFPWQSAGDGREESQRLHVNPRSGRWVPDRSRLQRHVGSAVAYNVWQYGQASGDTEFLHGPGGETLLQIARFWVDSARWDPSAGRYRIRGVIGPDEYHDGYPGSGVPGIDDNAYTNVMASWVLHRALDLVGGLPERRRAELFERIGVDEGEPAHWDEVSRLLRVPFHGAGGGPGVEGGGPATVISQFDGYGELPELDWPGYRERYGDIRRLDRILEAEGDSVNRYQASKQADVLMLGYLFSPGELAAVFDRLGYRLDDEIWRATVDYYLRRTSHGSTLSGLVHGWVLARARRADAWRYCQEALVGDIADVQGGTTQEGIHLGAMAGTLDLVQRGLTGMETREGALWLDPAPLPELSEFGISVNFQGHWGVGVRLLAGRLRVDVPPSQQPPVRVVLAGREVSVYPGESRWFDVPGIPAAAEGRPS